MNNEKRIIGKENEGTNTLEYQIKENNLRRSKDSERSEGEGYRHGVPPRRNEGRLASGTVHD